MRDREKKEKECLNCGKAIVNMNVYCNNTCQSEYQTKLKLNEWLNGKNIIQKGGCSIPPWMHNPSGYNVFSVTWLPPSVTDLGIIIRDSNPPH